MKLVLNLMKAYGHKYISRKRDPKTGKWIYTYPGDTTDSRKGKEMKDKQVNWKKVIKEWGNKYPDIDKKVKDIIIRYNFELRNSKSLEDYEETFQRPEINKLIVRGKSGDHPEKYYNRDLFDKMRNMAKDFHTTAKKYMKSMPENPAKSKKSEGIDSY